MCSAVSNGLIPSQEDSTHPGPPQDIPSDLLLNHSMGEGSKTEAGSASIWNLVGVMYLFIHYRNKPARE